MKKYPFNDVNKEKFQKVTICRKDNKIIDIVLGESLSVVGTYFKVDNIINDNIRIKEFNGVFGDEKCKMFAIKDLSISIDNNTIVVSSYTGMLVQYDGQSNPFVTDVEKLSDATLLVRRTERMKLINFSGETINKGWAVYQITPDSGQNVTVLKYPERHSKGKSTEIVNMKKGKSLGTFQEATYTSDMKHFKVRKDDILYNIMDFDGNLKFNWVMDIDDHVIASIDGNKDTALYFYVVRDIDDVVYNENFEEVINLTKEDVSLKISSASRVNHIVLMRKGAKEFNILDRNLKPMFDPWLDMIIYNYFSADAYLFLCHSKKGYAIMDGTTIKPVNGIPKYIEEIERLDNLTAGINLRYAIKIKDGKCKLFTYRNKNTNNFKLEFNSTEIKNVLTNGENTFVDTEDGLFVVIPSPQSQPDWYKKTWGFANLELIRCDNIFETYFTDEYVIERGGKFNIIKRNSEGMGRYFKTDIDNIYDIQNRFIIVERDGKFAYFDTTKFDLLSRDGITWWNDVEPAEELHPSGRWVFKVKDKQGNWIEA